MTLLKRWAPLLLAPVLLISACKSDSTTEDTLVGNWVSRFSFNGAARSEAASFTIGTKSYVGTGYDGLKRMSDFWEYDGATGLWRRVADMPGDARSGAVGFSVNGKGYIATGLNDNGIRLNDVYEYTPAAGAPGTWTKKQDFPGSARQDATAFAIGTKGYLATGFDGSYLKDFWEYNPVDDSWTEKAFPGNKRREAVAFVIGSKAYLATGINNGLLMNDFWEYDQTAGWTKKREITNVSTEGFDDNYTSITRSNGAAFVIGEKGFISTGENGANVGDTWQYDPSTDVWTRKTSFEGIARTGALGLTVNGKGIVMTGRNGSNPYDDLWEFLPDATKVDND